MRALAKKIFKNFSDEIKILTDTFERLYASNASTVAPVHALFGQQILSRILLQ